MSKFQQFTTNLAGNLRYEELEGRSYIVAPMVMLTEGVHNGTNGPLYYPSDEIGNPSAVANWNYKPIVIYHPEMNGQGISACDQNVINNRKVGVILNTHWDEVTSKLRAEAWLDLDKILEVDKDSRIIDALERNQLVEVSTGVFTENEDKQGEWNGEQYIAIARNLRADHLALLPDLVGACSIADGAGLLQMNSRGTIEKLKKSGLISDNALSHSDIRSSLFNQLRERVGEDGWLEDVFDDYFVYTRLDKMFKLGYTVDNSEVVIDNGPASEVRRMTDYITVNHKENEMKKKEVVDGLIANDSTKWDEKDRKFLMSLNEEQLEKMEPVVVENEEEEEEEETPAADPPKAPEQNSEGEGKNKESNKELTVNQYIEQAPAEIRDVLRHGVMTHNQQKQDLITKITANENNTFSKEFLKTKDLAELQAIAKLCGNEEKEQGGDSRFDYSGVAGSLAGNNSDHEEEALPLPVMNWDN